MSHWHEGFMPNISEHEAALPKVKNLRKVITGVGSAESNASKY